MCSKMGHHLLKLKYVPLGSELTYMYKVNVVCVHGLLQIEERNISGGGIFL